MSSHRFATLLVVSSMFFGVTAAAEEPSADASAVDASSTEAAVPEKSTAAKEPSKSKDKASTKAPTKASTNAPTKASEGPAKKIRSGRTIEVVARDLRLTDEAKERLLRIAARYHEATRKKLVITGGTRTPTRQAELMLQKLKHGEDIVKLYENRRAASEIRDAYLTGVAEKWTKKRIVRAMRDVILQQIARGVYVSKHLQAGAADVRSRDMSVEQEAAFRAAVSAEPGVTLIDERRSAEPHLHLSL